jgi:hypothetical protein
MPVAPALNWKQLPTYVPASVIDTGAGLLAAIKSILDSTTYIDGSSRTPGSGIAWQAASLADGSLKCTPGFANAFGQIVHLAKFSDTSASSVFSFGETRPTGGERVFANHILNPSATYTAGGGATPFGTTGTNTLPTRYFGYTPISPGYNMTTYGMNSLTGGAGKYQWVEQIRIFESQDAFLVHFWSSLSFGASSYPCGMMHLFGGFMAPVTADAGDAESDGILYGIVTSGQGDTANATTYAAYNNYFLANSTTSFMTHNAGVMKSHAGVFVPGTSTIRTMDKFPKMNLTAGAGAMSLTTFSNKLAKMPLYAVGENGFIGRYREMTIFKQGLMGALLRSGGVDRGYLFGAHITSVADCILLSM